jgi:hypothetical protein
MTGIRPTAVAYVSGPTKKSLSRQRRIVTEHAAAEGLALEHIVDDPADLVTISELVADVRACGAWAVLIPAGASMAMAQARVASDLEPHGAVCVVVGGPRAAAASQNPGRLATDPPHHRRNKGTETSARSLS